MNVNAYKFGDNVVDLEKVPPLSEPAVNYLRRLEKVDNVKTGHLTYIQVDVIAACLKKYADDLAYIKNHPVANVVSAITRSVLTAAIVGAGVLGVLYTSFPILCGLGAGLVYFIAAGENSSREHIIINFNVWDIALLVIGGPVFPFVGLFNKKERLEGLTNLDRKFLNIHLKQRETLFKADFTNTIKNLQADVEFPGCGKEATSIAMNTLNEIKANIAFFSPKTV